MHYTEGSLMPFMLLALIVGMIRNSPVPFFIKPVTGRYISPELAIQDFEELY